MSFIGTVSFAPLLCFVANVCASVIVTSAGWHASPFTYALWGYFAATLVAPSMIQLLSKRTGIFTNELSGMLSCCGWSRDAAGGSGNENLGAGRCGDPRLRHAG